MQKLQTSPVASSTLNQHQEDHRPVERQSVFDREVVSCLTDSNAFSDHVFNSNPLMSKSDISPGKLNHGNFNSTETNIMNYVCKDYFTYAQNRSHFPSAKLQGRIFCTSNAKFHQSIRLCHQSSNQDTSQPKSNHANSSTNTEKDSEAKLSHTDAQGRAAMVDVSGKTATCRTATAQATVLLGPTAFSLLRQNQLAKGDALAVAQVAGIGGSKQTSTLIPLCHPLPLDHVSLSFELDEKQNAAIISATCRTTGRTGVEMEALTAVSVAALTVYDMCKAVSHNIIITDIKLVSKTGGKKDFNRLQDTNNLN